MFIVEDRLKHGTCFVHRNLIAWNLHQLPAYFLLLFPGSAVLDLDFFSARVKVLFQISSLQCNNFNMRNVVPSFFFAIVTSFSTTFSRMIRQ